MISAVVFITISIQFYWVFKNYEESERQLERDINTSFDLAVEDYFTNESKRNTLGFYSKDGDFPKSKMDSILTNIGKVIKSENEALKFPEKEQGSDSLNNKDLNISGIQVFKGLDRDTAAFEKELKTPFNRLFIAKDSSKTGKATISNLRFTDDQISGSVREVSDRIVISFATNQMDLEKVDSLMSASLESYGINIDHGFLYNDGDDDFTQGTINGTQIIESDSPQLYQNTNLKLIYSGGQSTLLKRNLTSISLSFLLICGVIFCLFYMLWIIRKQKELSTIKNDLISNITHEFKTPIATASAALEGVQNFTTTGDIEKSTRYLGIGREQLAKLNLMVEKLLETATIDSDKLALQKTKFSLSDSIEGSVNRYKDLTHKSIELIVPDKEVEFYGDEFHLENAINNLIDNAIKYGGDAITIKLEKITSKIHLEVKDDGSLLEKKDAKLLFDKFYRVPSGDRHTVKGHGIGLFYTKAIIEKHGGSIFLDVKPTTFKIELPYE
ncbi:two-component system, OmpR family, phosphate regulon sensor histidine kinase PhoR [Nonlabens sp. Hel1_33_55]|uniref:sensor histidine kinase n=1 Tax=Nonlabens sp. Hel1_33_55 TaxID=1336802 RepID=UPI000875DBB4|nr:HAMP domain-containing sensor histidine kinase [Nonlabens sp. Hel1_33_55]SCY27182.1 two-component system, OmpR family, phosphate regulon sensor histidine kinase PhoR [Nonlabens sp. Hel1_33_55]